MQKDNILNIGNNPIIVVDLALHIKSSGNFYPNLSILLIKYNRGDVAEGIAVWKTSQWVNDACKTDIIWKYK